MDDEEDDDDDERFGSSGDDDEDDERFGSSGDDDGVGEDMAATEEGIARGGFSGGISLWKKNAAEISALYCTVEFLTPLYQSLS